MPSTSAAVSWFLRARSLRQHVGNLKVIDGRWKFKAIGYDLRGAVVPGGGPLTESHNTQFDTPDAADIGAVFART